MAVKKKSKRKMQHRVAVAAFKEWIAKHPRATHKQKFDQFDLFVDTSVLVEEDDDVHATAA